MSPRAVICAKFLKSTPLFCAKQKNTKLPNFFHKKVLTIALQCDIIDSRKRKAAALLLITNLHGLENSEK